MYFSFFIRCLSLWLLFVSPGAFAEETKAAASGSLVTVSPQAVVLDSPESSQQLIVTATDSDARTSDATRVASYSIADPAFARVDEGGMVWPLSNGTTEIVVEFESLTRRVPLEVRRLDAPVPLSFPRDIIPILTKAGCNSGSCHGKAEGKNGFKLSVFGYDPYADWEALVRQARGRRANSAAPEASLFLRKAVASAPHGGGRAIEPESLAYRRLTRWIAEGAFFQSPTDENADAAMGVVVRVDLEPSSRSLQFGKTQQLRITAFDGNGRSRCVTSESEYSSNAEAIASVDEDGLITAGEVPGEAVILVRYMGQVTVCRITLPQEGVRFERPPEVNFVDGFVWDKLERLGIAPSEQCDDSTFLRRVFLDVIGTLPTAAESRSFLTSEVPDKRERLIDRVLDRPEYADYWAQRWSDILRVDKDKISPQGAVAVTRWLRRQFSENRRYDEFVRDILTAQGNTRAAPAALYSVFDSPEVLSRSMSQLFLGVRIECAQCHHHPFERWGQDDYVGLAGFFTGIKKKNLPIGGTAVIAKAGGDLRHPRTGEVVATRALGSAPADLAGVGDRRSVLVDWMTAGENPFFAHAIVNRLWSHYFGRGLVDPVDDLRVTNPSINEGLHNALARHLRELQYDLKAFTKTLLMSRVYQTSSVSNEFNESDVQNFSRAPWKSLSAEVLLDTISQATGVPEKFAGWPLGYRAIQIWDNRMPSYFFRVFGRPVRASVCECERSGDPSIAQALHLMNSPEIMKKIQDPDGIARRLAASSESVGAILDKLFLATVSRFPTDTERKLLRSAFGDTDRQTATEDVLWTLLNTKEFLFNH